LEFRFQSKAAAISISVAVRHQILPQHSLEENLLALEITEDKNSVKFSD